jgi:hypothetical protein
MQFIFNLGTTKYFLWHYSPNLGLGLPPWTTPFHFGLLDLKTFGRTPWAGDQLIARPLPVHKHRKTHIHTQTRNIHALSGIRNHDPGFEDSAYLLDLLDYRDQQQNITVTLIRAVGLQKVGNQVRKNFVFTKKLRQECGLLPKLFKLYLPSSYKETGNKKFVHDEALIARIDLRMNTMYGIL